MPERYYANFVQFMVRFCSAYVSILFSSPLNFVQFRATKMEIYLLV